MPPIPETSFPDSPGRHLRIGKSVAETERRRRRWRIGLVAAGGMGIAVAAAIRHTLPNDGTVSTDTILQYVFLFIMGAAGIITGLALPRQAFEHPVSIDVTDSALIVSHVLKEQDVVPFGSLRRVVVAYAGPWHIPYSFDRPALIFERLDSPPLEIPCGRCRGEVIERFAEQLRSRADGDAAPLGDTAGDREWRRKQTRERPATLFFWLALLFPALLWIQTGLRECETNRLLDTGERAAATVTAIDEEGNTLRLAYEFTDAAGGRQTGSCSLRNWNGRVPKVNHPVEVVYYPAAPSESVPTAALSGGHYLPFHLMMIAFCGFMAVMLLRAYGCPLPVLFRGQWYLARPGVLTEEQWMKRNGKGETAAE